jgi:DmsE family decaheme c-type cytochrome
MRRERRFPWLRSTRNISLEAMIRVCVLVFAACIALPAQQAKPADSAKPAPGAEPAAAKPMPTDAAAAKPTYVGTEVCQTCHEDIAKAFVQNPHHAVETEAKRGWAGKGCESCHGPGSNHIGSASAADIRNPSTVAPAATDRICLTCHLNQPTHAGRILSSHAKNQVACTACHKIHANGPFGLVARKPAAVNELCGGCHLSVWAQFQKPYTHRLVQNAMSCVDCHNPHGSFRPGMMQFTSANEPGCFKCHSEVRGPFTFEHAPVRFEGCGTCHESHGSANPRMLTRQDVRQVCLDCHANLPLQGTATANAAKVLGVVPPAFHDLRSPRYRNCTVCHQKVHGSFVDRNLLR